MLAHPRRHAVAGDRAEYRGVGDAVAAEPIRAVHAAGILAGDEKAAQRGGAVGGELDAAHHVVRSGNHFDQSASKIEAAVGATLDHALELLAHALGTEVSHGNVEPAMRRRVALADLAEHRARYEVARGTLGLRIVGGHEPLFVPSQKETTGAAQTFL